MKKSIYVFVRKDLAPIQRLVQTAHVCLELSRKVDLPDERYNIVVLGIRSLAKLREVIIELDTLQINSIKFEEPDLGEMTSIATVPLTKEQGLVLSRYKLLEE